MQGIIGFEHNKITCKIGVEDWERKNPQEIYIDLKVKLDFTPCVATDTISDTISYVDLSDICIKTANSKTYFLLETLAHDILEILMSDKRIFWASIKIKKPQAIPSASFAIVELERSST